jgi:hypothetical protein
MLGNFKIVTDIDPKILASVVERNGIKSKDILSKPSAKMDNRSYANEAQSLQYNV